MVHTTVLCASSRYLQRNRLSGFDGCACLPQLKVLDISRNAISSFQGLVERLPALETLVASNNLISAGLDELASCNQLCTLDLSHNKLESLDEVLHSLQQLPALRSLYLEGNLCTQNSQNVRKRVIASLPLLTFLNNRPVNEIDRRCCAAW